MPTRFAVVRLTKRVATSTAATTLLSHPLPTTLRPSNWQT